MLDAEREKSSVAFISLMAAVLLTVTKLIVGILTNSLGILSEAAHSGLDLVAALVTYIAIKYSSRPADQDHHYGHGKIESVSALFETALLIFTCFWIASEALSRIFGGRTHQVEVNIYSFGVMLLSITIDAWRSRALYRVAEKYNSEALAADALHFSSDILSSSVVIIGLVGVILGFEYADPLAALLVAFLVVIASIRLGKRSVDSLLDKAPSEQVDLVEQAIRNVEGVLGFRDLRMRRVGSKTFVDVNIKMDPSLSLSQAHTLSENVEAKISGVLPQADTIVHMEPHNEEMSDMFDRLNLIARQLKLNIYNVNVQQSENGQFRISVYLELPGDMLLTLAHEQADTLEKKIGTEIPEINEIRIHIESRDRVPQTKPPEITHQVPHLIKTIETLAKSITGVIKIDKIVLEQKEGYYNLFLNCQVSREIQLKDAHEIASQIEKKITDKVSRVSEVFVHTEPVSL